MLDFPAILHGLPALPSSGSTAPRIVVDTNVWLSVLVWADPRDRWLLDRALGGDLSPVWTSGIRSEWSRVLGYPEFQLDETRRQGAFDLLEQLCTNVDGATELRWLPRCADVDDQKFLEAAVLGAAKCLVTRDKALLRLRKRVPFRIASPEQAAHSLFPVGA